MNFLKLFVVLFVIITVVSDADPTLAAAEGLPKSFPLNSTLDNHSHEEFHMKSYPDSSIQTNSNSTKLANLRPEEHSSNISNSSLHQLDIKAVTKTDLSVTSTNITKTIPNQEKVNFAEGGIEVSPQYHLKNKANETNKDTSTVKPVTAQPSSTTKIISSPTHSTTPGVNSTQIHKRIHGRPGVSEIVTPSISTNKSSSTTTIRPRKKKPLFTMITGDKETKISESFIESPTTGRDYVLPIVLIILSLPIVGYLIKIIYRRGTEFTERQQYHRMYLIDGMYNSR